MRIHFSLIVTIYCNYSLIVTIYYNFLESEYKSFSYIRYLVCVYELSSKDVLFLLAVR